MTRTAGPKQQLRVSCPRSHPGLRAPPSTAPGIPAPSGSPGRHGAPLAPGSTVREGRAGRGRDRRSGRSRPVPSRPVEPPRLARRPLGQSTAEPARPPPARKALPYLAEHLQVVFLIVQRQHLGGGEQRTPGRVEGTGSEMRVDSGPFPASGERRPRYPALRLHPALRARAAAPPQPLSAGPQSAAPRPRPARGARPVRRSGSGGGRAALGANGAALGACRQARAAAGGHCGCGLCGGGTGRLNAHRRVRGGAGDPARAAPGTARVLGEAPTGLPLATVAGKCVQCLGLETSVRSQAAARCALGSPRQAGT